MVRKLAAAYRADEAILPAAGDDRYTVTAPPANTRPARYTTVIDGLGQAPPTQPASVWRVVRWPGAFANTRASESRVAPA